MAAPLLNENEIRFLRALLQRKVRFLVVGLSAAALQGAPVVTQDVDLWFEELTDPKIREALKEVNAAYAPPSHLNPPMFVGGEIELFDIVLTLHGLGNFSEEWQNSIEVPMGDEKLRVLRLDRIIASKRKANRPKDQLVLPVLEDSLAASAASRMKGEKGPDSNPRPDSG